MINRENETLMRYKAHKLSLFKDDKDHKAQNLELQSQIEKMKQ